MHSFCGEAEIIHGNSIKPFFYQASFFKPSLIFEMKSKTTFKVFAWVSSKLFTLQARLARVKCSSLLSLLSDKDKNYFIFLTLGIKVIKLFCPWQAFPA
jgi:hypothetical protein